MSTTNPKGPALPKKSVLLLKRVRAFRRDLEAMVAPVRAQELDLKELSALRQELHDLRSPISTLWDSIEEEGVLLYRKAHPESLIADLPDFQATPEKCATCPDRPTCPIAPPESPTSKCTTNPNLN